ISTCEAWILELWGKNCGPYMQALQFFRGLGYIVGPILANPFLSSDDDAEQSEQQTQSTISTNSTTPSSVNGSSTTEPPKTFNDKVHIPYLINSALLALGAVLLI